MSKDSLGTARCGRCAQILPDETMTYCLSCGTPFSKIPPTHQYQLIGEKVFSPRHRVQAALLKVAKIYLVTCILFFVGLSFLEFRWVEKGKQLQENPSLEIYSYDFKDGPVLSDFAKRQALAVAIQSFEDHFGAGFGRVTYMENQIPKEMQFLETKEGRFLSRDLSFWDQIFFKNFNLNYYAEKPLKIFITNIPIYAKSNDLGSEDIEISHLGENQLVSGLGHPAFVLVSTYRMLTQESQFFHKGGALAGPQDQARFLGEYLMAHELGHALLGLKDYIYDFEPVTRTPASERPSPDNFEECLMHSDRGGGFLAWKKIKLRPLGKPSKCKSYAAMTEAFKLRSQAIKMLKQGKRAEAEALHQRATQLALSSAQGWVGELWQREHPIFQSMFRRWINALFVVKLSNDSS